MGKEKEREKKEKGKKRKKNCPIFLNRKGNGDFAGLESC
jgi:hypothetical protein